jgi:NitT/TauT family transport system ATP-binding protein
MGRTMIGVEDLSPVAASPRPGVVASLRGAEVHFELPGTSGRQIRRALDGISLDVRDGELLVLVGQSGCGKTTVLNLLVGIVSATGGSVTVLGDTPERARSRIGYMFARDALLPWRTARRNVEFGVELRRPDLSRAKRRELAQSYLDELGVGQSPDHYPWQLSQGMRQRVALARTWAIEPEVLLMDEPFAALDAQTRASVQEHFLQVWAAHRRTVVFVTHDLHEAILLADRIVVMAEGRVVDETTIDLPRPRHAETLVLEPEYRDIHQRLVAALHTARRSTARHQDRSSS